MPRKKSPATKRKTSAAKTTKTAKTTKAKTRRKQSLLHKTHKKLLKKVIPKKTHHRLIFGAALVIAAILVIYAYSSSIRSDVQAVAVVKTTEAEKFTWTPTDNYAQVSDAAASDGKAVKLTGNATGTASITQAGPAEELRVTASGKNCFGDPTMQVTLDGKVLDTKSISDGWKQYSFPATIKEGKHTVDIAFTNENTVVWFWIFKICSRSLFVDKVDMSVVMPDASSSSPSPSPSTSSSSSPSSGTSSGSSASTPSSSPSASSGSSADSSIVGGYSAHTLWQSDPINYVKLAANGGAKVIRDDVTWADVEKTKGSYDWSGTDKMMATAASNGVRVLLVVLTSPSWANGGASYTGPPNNASDYGNFVGKVAARYGTNGAFWSANPTLPKYLPIGIELWNEPNLNVFWGSKRPDPAKYTSMLIAGYNAAKAADSSLTVVSAGLSPAGGYNDIDCNGTTDSGISDYAMNPVNFLKSMYANGAAKRFDALGWHPYNYWGGATGAQMVGYHQCSAWSQMAETPVSARSLMASNGDSAKTIWATELGAPTCTSGSYTCVSEAEQGNLATQTMKLWKGYSWHGLYFWYDLRDDNGGDSTTDIEEHFGAVRANGTLKPSYTALKSAFTQK